MITTVLAEDVSVRVADAYYTAIARLTDTRQIEKNRSFNTKIVYTGISIYDMSSYHIIREIIRNDNLHRICNIRYCQIIQY